MHFSWKIVSAGLALSNLALAFAPTASAAPKEDVAASTLERAQALGQDDPGPD
jgi:hypothetical protein